MNVHDLGARSGSQSSPRDGSPGLWLFLGPQATVGQLSSSPGCEQGGDGSMVLPPVTRAEPASKAPLGSL